MKTKFNAFLGAVIVFAAACSEDVPNPAFPDVNSIPEEPLKAFNLVSPESGLQLNIKPGNALLNISWNESEGAEAYEWIADEEDGDFSTPLLVIPADDEGTATSLSLTYSQVYTALDEAGVAEGSRIKLKWSVRAITGNEKRIAATPRFISFQKGGVRFTVTVPQNTPSDHDVYLAGQFGFLPGASDWQQPGTNPSLKMNNNGDGTYSIILGIPENQTFEYKYFIAATGTSDWSKGEQAPNDNGVGVRGASNRSFTYNGSNDEIYETVSFWENFSYEYIMIKLAAPQSTPANKDVFVAGEFNKLGAASGAWQQPGTNAKLKMTKSGDFSYFIVFPKPDNGTNVEFKFFLATLAQPSWDNGSNGGNRSFSFDGSNYLLEETVTSWDGI